MLSVHIGNRRCTKMVKFESLLKLYRSDVIYTDEGGSSSIVDKVV